MTFSSKYDTIALDVASRHGSTSKGKIMAVSLVRIKPSNVVLDALHFAGYLAPLLLLLAGFLVPALRHKVGAVPPEDAASLWMTLIIFILAAVVWIFLDFFVVSNDSTTGSQLKLNAAISGTYNNVLLFAAGAMWAAGEMRWWMVVPIVATLVDDYIVTNRAINNALQKPIIQQGVVP